ncbi:MAG: transposase [Candidatus Competibacteraceae bacterium]
MSKQKQKYRIRNWRAYNAALVERGSLTVWFDDTHRAQWYETAQSGRRGAPRRYSDGLCNGLVIREVFHLPLRAMEGLMRSIITLLGVDVTIPDYSTFSRWRGFDRPDRTAHD